MAKDVQMSVKMEPTLRDEFMAVAARRDRPAAQIMRDLMRAYIADHKVPNEVTAEAILISRRGEGLSRAATPSELFAQLDI